MASFAYGFILAFCVAGPVLCRPTGRNEKKTNSTKDPSSDDFGLANKHYKVVTIPDNLFVIQNKTGTNVTFTGPYVSLLDAFAAVGNFTYEITAQADKKFGKKHANGKFNGMIGDTVNGKYDIILANIAFTKDIAQVLSGSAVKVNVSEWILFNPKMKSDKKDYIVQKNLDYFLLKNSDDRASKAIWTNIKARMPASIVPNVAEAVKQVKAGKYFVTGDDESILTISDDGNAQDLSVDPNPVFPNIPVYPFATKKGAEIGFFINTLLALLSDDESTADNWMNEIMETIISGGWDPSGNSTLEFRK